MSFIEVYKLEKLEFKSETPFNYAPPNNSSPSTFNYNINKIKFYLYLLNNEIYINQKMEYLKKIVFNNKKI